MKRWVVEYSFTDSSIVSISFTVNDYDSALNVIRVIKFEQEVFRISLWQRREHETNGPTMGTKSGSR